MPRKRKYLAFDEARTLELQIDGLMVVSGEGDDVHYTAVLASDPAICPRCHKPGVERKQTATHLYNDAIPLGEGKFKFIELTYAFSKYRCTNPDCKHVFTPLISFAEASGKSTYRFTDAVVKSVMKMSYRQLSESIPFLVTPQAIGTIFRGWYDNKEAIHNSTKSGLRSTPSTFGIVTAASRNQVFTLFLDCDNDEISIMEVIPEVGTMAVADALAKYDKGSIGRFVISCSQVIAECLRACYPGIKAVIPGGFYFDTAMEDYVNLALDIGRNCTETEQTLLREAPLGKRMGDRDAKRVGDFLRDNPRLHEAFDQVDKLRLLLSKPFEYKDLFDWAEQIPINCEDAFVVSKECVSFFREELMAGVLVQSELPTNLYKNLAKLRELTLSFDENTPEVLRSRILYIDMTKTPDYPEGERAGNILLSKAISNLEILKDNKPKTYNRRRRYANK